MPTTKDRTAYFAHYYRTKRKAPSKWRPCAFCGAIIKGRTNRKFCNDKCRISAWRASH
jgi:hypothetical protein